MVASQKYLVNLIGIDVKDNHFIKVVFKLSESRNREYEIIQDRGSELENFNAADIVIVDKDSSQSIDKWKELVHSAPGKHSESTIFITSHKEPILQKNTVLRPLVALRILNILDAIDIKERDVAPPVTSGTSVTQPQHSHNNRMDSMYNVLIIDDSQAVREHIGAELNKYQCHVDFAANAEEGYWLIQKNEYSLVFLDVVLPGMNGHELCKGIKGSALLRDTPIVMLTSKSSPFDRVKGRLAGCNDYIVKPVKARKLHQIIEKYVYTDKSSANILSL